MYHSKCYKVWGRSKQQKVQASYAVAGKLTNSSNILATSESSGLLEFRFIYLKFVSSAQSIIALSQELQDKVIDTFSIYL